MLELGDCPAKALLNPAFVRQRREAEEERTEDYNSGEWLWHQALPAHVEPGEGFVAVQG